MERILVIRSGAIGDLIVTLPVLAALREHYPDARLEVMGYPETLSLVHGRYYADAVASIDQAGMARFHVPGADLPDDLVRHLGAFDLILALVKDPNGTFCANLRCTGAKRVLGFDPLPSPECTTHMVDYTAEALKPLGIPVADRVPRLYPSAEDRAFVECFWHDRHLQSEPERWVVALHPGSGGRAKAWPADHFVRLARWISPTLDARVLLVSGPADAEAVEIMLGELREAPPLLVEGLALPELAAVLQRCDAFVGSDSGVTHIAAAVGTPTVAVFGPTDPRVWGPRGEGVHIVQVADWNETA